LHGGTCVIGTGGDSRPLHGINSNMLISVQDLHHLLSCAKDKRVVLDHNIEHLATGMVRDRVGGLGSIDYTHVIVVFGNSSIQKQERPNQVRV
jgi:hypothetical protein